MLSSTPSRRSFILSAGATAVGIAGSSATAYAANEAVNVGIIGCGGRARHLLKSLVNVPGVNVTSLCDVWDNSFAETEKLLGKELPKTKSYKALLEMKNIDAVLIGSPDHWHVPLTIASCEAKKDVYVEKPLTHDLSEGKAVIAAQNDHKRIVQVGTQQRSMPHIIAAKKLVQDGKIGKVLKVHMSWNRNSNRIQRFKLGIDPKSVDWKAFLGTAKDQEFDEYRFRNWRWFWDFGGGIFTDLMVHWIDVAHFVLENDKPEKAVSLGEFFNAKDVWETPDTVQTILSYPGGVQMHFEGTFSNARLGAMIEFMGTEGSIYIDRGRYEVIPEKNKKLEASDMILGTGPKGLDFYDKPDGEMLHLTNWIECVRSRKTPSAPAESGVSGAAAAHLANIAMRTGQTAKAKS